MSEKELYEILKQLAQKTIAQLKDLDKLSAKELAQITAENVMETVKEIKELEARS